MVFHAIMLMVVLLAFQKPAEKPVHPIADRVLLNDGSVILGMIVSEAGGPRGQLEMIVSREWAEAHLKSRAAKWTRAIESATKQAISQRKSRLRSWKAEREAHEQAGDRILTWIGEELKRLEDPSQFSQTPLMPVQISRTDLRSISRQSPANLRLLQLGWSCGLPNVEGRSLDGLKDAIEGRGFSVDGDRLPNLTRLLPLSQETDQAWLTRRAATELAIDPGLRFIRYQNMVLPDQPGGGAAGLNGLNLSAAVGEISKLLNPEGAGAEDPLVAVLKQVGNRGRVGAVVTRLDMAADFSSVTVQAMLWVRVDAERWMPAGSRTATVRPDDLADDAGRRIENDPQVQSAFNLLESLGLGSIPAEYKQRSLRMGAATEQAMGSVRAASAEDLNALMLPIFDSREEPRPTTPPDKPEGPDTSGRAPATTSR